MRQEIPAESDFRYTVSTSIYSANLATESELRRAMETVCYLCGRFLGTSRIYLEDPDAPGTFCHLSCFHRYHFEEDWYRKALADRENVSRSS